MLLLSTCNEEKRCVRESLELRASLRTQLILPLEQLIKEILELTSCSDASVAGTGVSLKKLGDRAIALRGRSIDYWMMLEDRNELLTYMNDRIDPIHLLSQIFAVYRGRLKVYVSANEDLGVLYGNEDWLTDALRAVIEHMHHVHGMERVVCELNQNNDELFISFQCIGLVIPSVMEEMEFDNSKLTLDYSVIDMALARRILYQHGGSMRSIGSSDTVRFVVSFPTGAPYDGTLGTIHEQIEAE